MRLYLTNNYDMWLRLLYKLGSDSVVDSLLTVAPDVGSVFVLWFAMHCLESFLGLH